MMRSALALSALLLLLLPPPARSDGEAASETSPVRQTPASASASASAPAPAPANQQGTLTTPSTTMGSPALDVGKPGAMTPDLQATPGTTTPTTSQGTPGTTIPTTGQGIPGTTIPTTGQGTPGTTTSAAGQGYLGTTTPDPGQGHPSTTTPAPGQGHPSTTTPASDQNSGTTTPAPGQGNRDTGPSDQTTVVTPRPDSPPAVDSDGSTQSGPITPPENKTTGSQNVAKDADQSGGTSKQDVTTACGTPGETTQVACQSPSQDSASKTTPAINPQPSGSSVTSKPRGSTTEKQSTNAPVPGSGPVDSPTVTAPVTAATPISDLSATIGGGKPAPETSTSMAPQPASPLPGPTGIPSSSPKPTTTAPQGSTTYSPTSALGSHKVKCEAPEKPNEKMLVLNLTKASPCVQGPLDEKLITILCKTVKSSFSAAQDQCHIRLAPVPESQAVVVKEISIQTNLLPSDIYELLKDKWDDLKDVGVSDMQLGDQGPPEEAEDRFSMPLIIAIVCMASFLLLVAALYGCCHQRLSHRRDQQRLTEELQTVENGYHDNPTLEVMETSSEMQEKKVVNLNGELGDSWIVPLDNLSKDDLDEEEDTHL
ncbi:podocalyxin isoform X2 [Elephas maximus indicus]|uniref:podocalyxin isoform X2 n=1 Tax=Elephas maximus indicus TaxID=99487 RepID=UPI00211714FA|nr:podocalyxin isoform X2 [Elephas maximus indicus]